VLNAMPSVVLGLWPVAVIYIVMDEEVTIENYFPEVGNIP